MRGLARDSRIEAIAGEPVVDISATTFGPSATELDTSAGVSMYTAIDLANFLVNSVDPIAYLGQPLNDTVANTYTTLRVVGDVNGTSGSFQVRRSNAQGPTVPVPSLGKLLVAWGLNAGLAQTLTVYGGDAIVDTGALMNYGSPVLLQVATSSAHTHLRTVGYSGTHTAWQQAMIMQRLALDLGISAGGGSG